MGLVKVFLGQVLVKTKSIKRDILSAIDSHYVLKTHELTN